MRLVAGCKRHVRALRSLTQQALRALRNIG
jgi:hypothetical protein